MHLPAAFRQGQGESLHRIKALPDCCCVARNVSCRAMLRMRGVMEMRGENAGVTTRRGGSNAPRLMDEVRRHLRLKHYSLRTEQAYTGWVRRFIFANGKRHPRTMGGAEVERFLSSLAVRANVSAGTQNQALSALLFLYREVLGVRLPWMDQVVRAK